MKDLPADERARKILAVVSRLGNNQNFRRENFLRYYRLYSNYPVMGFGVAAYARPVTFSGNRLAFNVIKNCSDAFVAKVTKDHPKVTYLTSGADWEMQQKAESLDKFTEGLFYEAKVYEQAPLAVLDAAICGTGIMKVAIEGEGEDQHIVLDRVLPWWHQLDEVRRRVMVDLMFNMGAPTLMQFTNTLAHIQAGRYREAAEGMLASKWAQQTGARARRLAAMMGSGRDWVS